MIKRVLVLAMLITIAAWMPVLAGDGVNVQGLGMARTGVALARGLDAVGVNPANIAVPFQYTFTFSLVPVGVHAGTDFMDYEIYNTYFTGVDTDTGRVGRYLTESDKQHILDGFPEDKGRFAAEAEARLFGASLLLERVGGFAFTITDHAGVFGDIPRDYAEFILHGNPPGSRYDFGKTVGEASWTREYALTFGAAIPGMSFMKWAAGGATVKLVHGFAHFNVERSQTSLVTGTNGVLTGTIDYRAREASIDAIRFEKGDAQVFPTPAGTGFGLDLGVAGGLTDYLDIAISVTQIGSVTWTKNTEEFVGDTVLVVDDPLATEQRDGIEDAVKGKRRQTGEFSTPLPTTLRIGVAIAANRLSGFSEFPGELLLALDYTQGFHNTVGAVTTPRFSMGAEYKPVSWLPIRTGVSFGGTDRVNMAFGLGIHVGFYTFDIATENIGWLFAPNSFARASAAVGMRLRF